jgi:hypothetical protein
VDIIQSYDPMEPKRLGTMLDSLQRSGESPPPSWITEDDLKKGKDASADEVTGI